jgi:hypothetical protein
MWDRVELSENGPKKDVKEERKKDIPNKIDGR